VDTCHSSSLSSSLSSIQHHRVDSLDDIVANKLCALLGRSETKDLVDLFCISGLGVPVLDYLPHAATKDAGMDPSTLAWVLSGMPIDLSTLDMLKPIRVEELTAFRDTLVQQLVGTVWPGTDPRQE
jgi:hypothetical protein